MSTPASLRISTELSHYFRQLDRDQITHWLMRLSSGRTTDIDDGLGGRITIGGAIEFSGTPRDVFWRFIHPILEAKIVEVCRQVEQEIKGYTRADALETLEHVEGALRGLVARTFRSMADVDRRLRGKGEPKSVPLKDVSAEVSRHHQLIAANISASRRELVPPPIELTGWQTTVAWFRSHDGWNIFFAVLAIVSVAVAILAL